MKFSITLSPLFRDLLDTHTLLGASVWGVFFLVISTFLAAGIRRFERRVEAYLSDVTGVRFASAFGQVMAYVIGFILYAHLIPELRIVGTGLLAGVGVVSIVLGVAAQNTLSNLVAGFSLVLYRPFRVGDNVQINTANGQVSAIVEVVSLGYTCLRDSMNQEIIVPNSVMAGSIVIRKNAPDASLEEPPSNSSVGK
jgi:small-conductance mechanosensitive channel